MTGENYFKDYVVKGLTKRFSACFVTKHNDLNPGVPDLSVFVKETQKNTWMELKAESQFPQRARTRLKLYCYTEEQALFLRQRKGWLFARVKRNYFLFNADQAWACWVEGGFTKAEFSARATAVWHGAVNWRELASIIGRVGSPEAG